MYFSRKGHVVGRGIFVVFDTVDIMGVSKKGGKPPKWMVKIREIGNPYEQMRFDLGGTHPIIFGSTPIFPLHFFMWFLCV